MNKVSTLEKRWEAGVRVYVLKSQAATDLVHAIQQVSRGQFYLDPAFVGRLWNPTARSQQMPSDAPTVRERQMLQLIAEEGRQRMSLLGISVKTAESLRTRLMQKLDIHETVGLVQYAVRRGLVQP